jgi:hypothetical protein
MCPVLFILLDFINRPYKFVKEPHNRDFYLAGMNKELMLKIHSNNIVILYQTKKM